MLSRKEIIAWLSEDRPGPLAELYELADAARRENVGDDVHIRALIEISNHCERNCHYCGLRESNRKISRYRMTMEEILEAAKAAAARGRRTLVLQAGEDPVIKAEWTAGLVRALKRETGMAVTLSLGEFRRDDYFIMREAGADRYLLKHETIDPYLYRKFHPGMSHDGRLKRLEWLREAGFQVGAGIIVGLPGQTNEVIARDIEFMAGFGVDMAGIGPFIPHPETPLADMPRGSAELALKTVALTRLAIPYAHIPATTALATLIPDGAKRALMSGANVLMPNASPARFRSLYTIYPNRTPLKDVDCDPSDNVEILIRSIGRNVSSGFGHSLRPANIPVSGGMEAPI